MIVCFTEYSRLCVFETERVLETVILNIVCVCVFQNMTEVCVCMHI